MEQMDIMVAHFWRIWMVHKILEINFQSSNLKITSISSKIFKKSIKCIELKIKKVTYWRTFQWKRKL